MVIAYSFLDPKCREVEVYNWNKFVCTKLAHETGYSENLGKFVDYEMDNYSYNFDIIELFLAFVYTFSF